MSSKNPSSKGLHVKPPSSTNMITSTNSRFRTDTSVPKISSNAKSTNVYSKQGSFRKSPITSSAQRQYSGLKIETNPSSKNYQTVRSQKSSQLQGQLNRYSQKANVKRDSAIRLVGNGSYSQKGSSGFTQVVADNKRPSDLRLNYNTYSNQN